MSNSLGQRFSIVGQTRNELSIHFTAYCYKLKYVLFAELDNSVQNPMLGTVVETVTKLAGERLPIPFSVRQRRRLAQDTFKVFWRSLVRHSVNMMDIKNAVENVIVVPVVESLRQLDHKAGHYGSRQRTKVNYSPTFSPPLVSLASERASQLALDVVTSEVLPFRYDCWLVIFNSLNKPLPFDAIGFPSSLGESAAREDGKGLLVQPSSFITRPASRELVTLRPISAVKE